MKLSMQRAQKSRIIEDLGKMIVLFTGARQVGKTMAYQGYRRGLPKHVYRLNGYRGENCPLQYLRTKEGREADFCITRDDTIECVLEAKVGESKTSPALRHFCDKHNLNGTELVKDLKRERKDGKIEIRNAQRFFNELFL